MIEITSLSDDRRMYIMEQCDTCENNGKGADKCKINADGKCNYEEKTLGFRCHECVYALEHYDIHSKSYSYDCSIGKFFDHCKSFLKKDPLMQFPPETVSAKEITEKRFVPDLSISDDTTVKVAEEPKRMTHKIKIRESFAEAVCAGNKTFEVRKNDRGYQKGDLVKFTVLYDSDGLEMISHPLHDMTFEITYVLAGWGIEDGYVVFGIKPVK